MLCARRSPWLLPPRRSGSRCCGGLAASLRGGAMFAGEVKAWDAAHSMHLVHYDGDVEPLWAELGGSLASQFCLESACMFD